MFIVTEYAALKSHCEFFENVLSELSLKSVK